MRWAPGRSVISSERGLAIRNSKSSIWPSSPRRARKAMTPSGEAACTDDSSAAVRRASSVAERRSVTSANDTTTASVTPSPSWSTGEALTRYQRTGWPGGQMPWIWPRTASFVFRTSRSGRSSGWIGSPRSSTTGQRAGRSSV